MAAADVERIIEAVEAEMDAFDLRFTLRDAVATVLTPRVQPVHELLGRHGWPSR
jgi:hypothetical protein